MTTYEVWGETDAGWVLLFKDLTSVTKAGAEARAELDSWRYKATRVVAVKARTAA